MNNCVLPIDKNPVLRTYQHVAYSFSILGANQDSCNWLCNQYIQLVDDGNDIAFYLDFLNRQDAFEYARISCETIKEFKIDIVEFIRNEIKHGWYVYVCIDEFYIPERQAYQKFHFIHDCLIYGIDDIKREFCLIGYNDKQMYKESRASYKQVMESAPQYWICSIRKSEQYKFILDINKIFVGLKRYLNLIPEIIIGDIDYKSAVFGQETNYSLIRHMKKRCAAERGIDVRYIYLFYEHKKGMLVRLEQLQKALQYDSIYIAEYQKIVEEAKKLVSMTLKYNMKQYAHFCSKMEDAIKNIFERERRIILNVIDEF